MSEQVNNDGSSQIFFKESEKSKIKIYNQKDVVSNSIEFDGRKIDWFQQKNSWDCGPCMCLNMQDMLNTKNNSDAVSDVDSFRHWAENQTKMTKERRRLQNGQVLKYTERQKYTGDRAAEWLVIEDLRNYIKNYLGLKEVPIENVNNTVNLIKQESRNREIFVWGVDKKNSHYRGYFVGINGKNIYNVNSFDNGPEIAKVDDVSDFVRGAKGTCFIAVGPSPKITINSQRV